MAFPSHQLTIEHAASILGTMDAEDFIAANQQRFDDLPPPYSPAESTRLPSPAAAAREFDAVEQVRLRAKTRFRGTPTSMFELLTRREMERISHQASGSVTGRRKTLHVDERLDLKANAENNIREYWIEQDIWKDEWGPAWPPGSFPMDNTWLWTKSNTIPRPDPAGPWRHERTAEAARTCIGDRDAERPIDSSRPYQQFVSQASRERKWIADELAWEGGPNSIHPDLEAAAIEAVRKSWREDGIWQPCWHMYPGLEWAHELPDDLLERDPLYMQLYGPERLKPVFRNDSPQPDTDFACEGLFGRSTAMRPTVRVRASNSTGRTYRHGKHSTGLRRSQRLKNRPDEATRSQGVRRSKRIQERKRKSLR